MRPKTPEPSGSGDLFRSRLDQIINMRHELVRLADEIDWDWIDGQLADLYHDNGRPAVPPRFMVGLLFLKHIHGLSDEGVCERWVHDPYFRYLTGATLKRILDDAGYRGHNAPGAYKLRVFTTGQKRRVTPQIKRQMKRRAAVEPVIGHMKNGHRMDRNFLAHGQGDAINPILAAAGYNFRLILKWIRLLCVWITVLFSEKYKRPAPLSAA